MTCIISPRIKTKAQLKSQIKMMNESEITMDDISIEDPSPFAKPGRAGFGVMELEPGESVTVTNHPKRSWFAIVGRDSKGKLFVK